MTVFVEDALRLLLLLVLLLLELTGVITRVEGFRFGLKAQLKGLWVNRHVRNGARR